MEFLDAGGTVSGFRESRWNILQKIRVGNYFLCYLTGVSRWIGVLEIASAPFRDTTPIWKDESFPCRECEGCGEADALGETKNLQEQ